jgi:hypothetical protein
MLYVHSTHNYDAETIDLAERLFSRFVGRRLAATEYDEHVKLDSNVGRLNHRPIVAIKSIKAKINAGVVFPWAMDSDISLSDVRESGGNVLLPSSLFGVNYDEAHIRYVAGFESTPDDVEACVLEIARLIRERTLDEWSGMNTLSDESRATIQRWKEAR